jgi:hypothetical protein
MQLGDVALGVLRGHARAEEALLVGIADPVTSLEPAPALTVCGLGLGAVLAAGAVEPAA